VLDVHALSGAGLPRLRSSTLVAVSVAVDSYHVPGGRAGWPDQVISYDTRFRNAVAFGVRTGCLPAPTRAALIVLVKTSPSIVRILLGFPLPVQNCSREHRLRLHAIPSAVDPPIGERARPRRRHHETGVRHGNQAGGAGGGSARLARVDGGRASRSRSAPAGGIACGVRGGGSERSERCGGTSGE